MNKLTRSNDSWSVPLIPLSRTIGIVFASWQLVFVATRIWNRLQRPTISVTEAFLARDNVIQLAFGLVFIALAVVPDRKWVRASQIVTIQLFGVANAIKLAPADFGAELIFLASLVLAYRYGLLESRLLPKVLASLAVYVFGRVASYFFNYEYVFKVPITFQRLTNNLFIVLGTLVLLYVVYERTVHRLRRDRNELVDLHTRNRPFVEFGRNVSGLVHDLKNDVSLLQAFSDSHRSVPEEPLSREDWELYRRYVDRLQARIDAVRMVAGKSHRFGTEEVDVVTLVRSAMYVFQVAPVTKRNVRFEMDLPEQPVHVRVPPARLLSIIENVVGNSCDALVEHAAARAPQLDASWIPTVRASIWEEPDSVRIVLSDNGPGMAFCEDCESENCLDCSSLEVGLSTKADGAGLGLSHVMREAETIGADLVVNSRKGLGVTVTISLPRTSAVERR